VSWVARREHQSQPLPRNASRRPSRAGLATALLTVLALTRPALAENIFDSMGSKIKQGFTAMGDALTPKSHVEPAADPTSLQSPAKAGPDLHVAMGRLYEEQGKLPEAAQQYQQAMKMAPGDVRPVLGYAQVKVREKDLAEATRLYQQAAKIATQEPGVYNDMALCYAQRKMYREAEAAMRQAVRLQPNNGLYRNNLATILVDIGQFNEAFEQLKALQAEPVAHYNLGYLLQKKGQNDEALRHFITAANQDPKLTQARYWADKLGTVGGAGSPAAQVAAQPAASRLAPQATADRQAIGGALPAHAATPPFVSSARPPAAPGVVRLPAVAPSPGWPNAEARVAEVAPLPPVNNAAPGNWGEAPDPNAFRTARGQGVQPLPGVVTPLPPIQR